MAYIVLSVSILQLMHIGKVTLCCQSRRQKLIASIDLFRPGFLPTACLATISAGKAAPISLSSDQVRHECVAVVPERADVQLAFTAIVSLFLLLVCQ